MNTKNVRKAVSSMSNIKLKYLNRDCVLPAIRKSLIHYCNHGTLFCLIGLLHRRKFTSMISPIFLRIHPYNKMHDFCI